MPRMDSDGRGPPGRNSDVPDRGSVRHIRRLLEAIRTHSVHSPTVASEEGESAEGVADVGQGLSVAGVVELVGQQRCPPPLLGRDPHAGAGEAVVDPDVVIGVGARGGMPEQAAHGFEGAGLDGQ